MMAETGTVCSRSGSFEEARARGLVAVDDPDFAARQFLMSLKTPNCEEMLGLEPLAVEDRDDFVAKAGAPVPQGRRAAVRGE